MEGLTADQVVEINEYLVGLTSEPHHLLDADGLAAAVARPWSGFGESEAFPSIYDKAGALLHGIASRQVFMNGNKRTAWTAAVTFLELNGVDVGFQAPIQSDAFVRAVAVDHSFDLQAASEWFRHAHRQSQIHAATDPRLEYLIPAGSWDEGIGDGTVDVTALQIGGFITTVLPERSHFALISRIHWEPEDAGSTHIAHVELDNRYDGRVLTLDPRTSAACEISVPAPSGHPYHRDSLMPAIVSIGVDVAMVRSGMCDAVFFIDGQEVGRVPLRVEHAPSYENAPDYYF